MALVFLATVIVLAQGKDLLRFHRTQSLLGAAGFVESARGDTNIYGKPLQTCDPTGGAAGSSQENGKCDEKTGGIHSLCVSSLPGDFSNTTGQGTWTEAEQGKPWCVCIGAWSLYHAHGQDAEAHCDAIPDFVLGPAYINNWSRWNGKELDDQIIDGINVLWDQCSKGKGGSQLDTFNKKYCSIATAYMGKTKKFADTPEYAKAKC